MLVNSVVILYTPLSTGWLSLALMVIFSIGTPDLGPADSHSLCFVNISSFEIA